MSSTANSSFARASASKGLRASKPWRWAGADEFTFEAVRPAHFVLLAGAEIREPVLAHGPFIMNEMSQIEAAVAHYRAGDMGRLAPLVEDKGHLSLGAGPLRDDMNRLKPTGKEREHG